MDGPSLWRQSLQEELAASETKEAELQMELWQLPEVLGFGGAHCPLSPQSEGFWRSVSELTVSCFFQEYCKTISHFMYMICESVVYHHSAYDQMWQVVL